MVTSHDLSSIGTMNHATLVVNLLSLWLILQTSAMVIMDKWDVEELREQLQDPTKERIDLECDACRVMVDAIQDLARKHASEDTIVYVAEKLCTLLKIQDSLVCHGIIPEFKVSASYHVAVFINQRVWLLLCRMKFCTCSLPLLLDRRRFAVS